MPAREGERGFVWREGEAPAKIFQRGAAEAWHARCAGSLPGYLEGGGIAQTGVIGVSQQEQLSLPLFLWLFF